MKLRGFLLLLIVFGATQLLSMEHEKKDDVNNDGLHEIIVNSSSTNTCRLIFKACLENVATQKKTRSLTSSQSSLPHQVVERLGGHWDAYIVGLERTDPEMYALFMNFTREAEANGRSPEEIEDFIRKNLAELASIDMYKHLYNVQTAALEANKRKEFDLREMLEGQQPVNPLTLYLVLLYRSSSVLDKQGVQDEVDKSKECVEEWLLVIEKNDPEAYALLMSAFEKVKSEQLNQQDAIPDLLDAINKVNNLESLQNFMKNIQSKYQLIQKAKSIWSKAYAAIGAAVGLFTIISGSTGGVLGGLLGANRTCAEIMECTLARCFELANVTIG